MLIGICGGIGSGKSVVSRMLREKGYTVIDCDLEAKRLMAESSAIKEAIRDRISPRVTDGISIPDRKILADIVFSDEEARLTLNSIVHGALRERIGEIVAVMGDCPVFAEAAILAESGLARDCDRIWKVEAGESARLERVKKRDGATEDHIKARMKSQEREETLLREYAPKISVIENVENKSLIYQVDNLIDGIKEQICYVQSFQSPANPVCLK